MSLPPGPAASAGVQTVRWLFAPINFLESCRRKHGDAFSLQFLGFETPMVVISDPGSIRALYTSRENGLPPGRTIALEPVMGPRSVLLLEGSDHLARRRAMLPAFHGERMRAYDELITETADAEIDSWPLDEAFPIHPRMQAVTLEVILRAVFGVGDPARRERLRGLLTDMLGDLGSPVLQLRTMIARRFDRSDPIDEIRARSAEVDELIAAEIAERRQDPDLDQREDILSMLVGVEFEDGEGMSDGELRDQLITLLLAGHETTATALAWTVDQLLRNPRVTARLRADLERGSEDYLRATITESLRLRPVVPLAGRRLAAELEVGDYVLPAGTDVTPAFWLTHTRPDLYPEPLEFRPERFLEDSPDTYSWVPFGGGVRRCLGAAFAEFEMRIVLSRILERCDLRLVRSRPERITRRNVTFSPRHGTPVVVTSRRPASERVAELV